MYKIKTYKKKISIFFDFANTICFLKKKKKLILENFLNNKNAKFRRSKLSKVLNKVEEKFFLSELKKNKSKKKFYLTYNKYIQDNLKLNYIKNFPSEYYNFVKKIKNEWIISKENVDLIKNKSKKYEFYLASNFSLKAYKILKKYKIIKCFKKIYVSKKIQLEKPNLNFYNFIIKDSKVDPKLSYFIGDNMILDYKIPKKFKFKCFLINQNYKKNRSIKTCKNLKEFFKTIEKK